MQIMPNKEEHSNPGLTGAGSLSMSFSITTRRYRTEFVKEEVLGEYIRGSRGKNSFLSHVLYN